MAAAALNLVSCLAALAGAVWAQAPTAITTSPTTTVERDAPWLVAPRAGETPEAEAESAPARPSGFAGWPAGLPEPWELPCWLLASGVRLALPLTSERRTPPSALPALNGPGDRPLVPANLVVVLPPIPAVPRFVERSEEVAGHLDRLAAVAATHPLLAFTRQTIGRSQRGRDLSLVSVCRRGAAPAQVVMVVARQHGDEPAGAYGVLRLLHHLLTARDPGTLDLLGRVKLCAVPVANPDGSDVFDRRTACGVNSNRDWSTRRLPETRAVAAAVSDASPAALLDLHEQTPRDTEGCFVMGLPAGGARHVLGPVRKALKENGHTAPISDGGLTDRRLLAPWFASTFRRPALMVESRCPADSTAHLARRAAFHQLVVLSVMRTVAASEPVTGAGRNR